MPVLKNTLAFLIERVLYKQKPNVKVRKTTFSKARSTALSPARLQFPWSAMFQGLTVPLSAYIMVYRFIFMDELWS